VTVGNVTKVEMQGWHALLTMTLDATSTCRPRDCELGQTSRRLRCTSELAPPTDRTPHELARRNR